MLHSSFGDFLRWDATLGLGGDVYFFAAEQRQAAEWALAIETLRTIAADTDAPHAARVSAATALLDRAWGKPMQGHAVLAVSAPKSVREMSDGELMAMIEQKTAPECPPATGM